MSMVLPWNLSQLAPGGRNPRLFRKRLGGTNVHRAPVRRRARRGLVHAWPAFHKYKHGGGRRGLEPAGVRGGLPIRSGKLHLSKRRRRLELGASDRGARSGVLPRPRERPEPLEPGSAVRRLDAPGRFRVHDTAGRSTAGRAGRFFRRTIRRSSATSRSTPSSRTPSMSPTAASPRFIEASTAERTSVPFPRLFRARFSPPHRTARWPRRRNSSRGSAVTGEKAGRRRRRGRSRARRRRWRWIPSIRGDGSSEVPGPFFRAVPCLEPMTAAPRGRWWRRSVSSVTSRSILLVPAGSMRRP